MGFGECHPHEYEYEMYEEGFVFVGFAFGLWCGANSRLWINILSTNMGASIRSWYDIRRERITSQETWGEYSSVFTNIRPFLRIFPFKNTGTNITFIRGTNTLSYVLQKHGVEYSSV